MAAVSKQTLYRSFGDKEGVFTALVHRECDRVADPFTPLVAQLEAAASGEEAVRLLAEQFTASILSRRVQQLRRLVIAEATRFPELGQLYWDRGFLRVLSSVAHCLSVLGGRGLLRVADPEAAAQHLAGMLLWIPGNQQMFVPGSLTEDQVRRSVATAAAAFVCAYAPAAAAPSSVNRR